MWCCNENTDRDPKNLLQEEPYHIVPVNIVLLKEWVSEDKDLHDDKTNTQCRHLAKLLSINKGYAYHEHQRLLNIEGKAEVWDTLVKIVKCGLSLKISEESFKGNKEASMVINPGLRRHCQTNESIKEESRCQYPYSAFEEYLRVISRLLWVLRISHELRHFDLLT